MNCFKFQFDFFNDLYKRLEEKEDYFSLLNEFMKKTRNHYPQISKSAITGEKPEGHDFLMNKILESKPDVVAISIVYNSQAFFAKGIIDNLTKNGIKVVIGGPAYLEKIKTNAIKLDNYSQLISYLVENGADEKKEMDEVILDFNDYNKNHYFTKDIIYPIRTSSSCPYKKCAFCTHHGNIKYEEYDLSYLKKTIQKNNIKKICFIDDDLTNPRLEKISNILMNLEVKWWCQLRPLPQIMKILPKLKKSGLHSVAWGIESGNQRILDYMKKGTNTDDIKKVITKSSELGIKNTVYIMFGFLSETESEFIDTIKFLEENSNYIDLISPAVFGLQDGSPAYSSPNEYGIKNIHLEKRTLLGDKIEYDISKGLDQKQASKLKKKYNGTMYKINKVPKIINSCKEQILNYDSLNI